MPTLARHDAAPVEVEPRLLAGKYRTVQALEEAYVNVERERGRLGNEVGELRRELDFYRDAVADLLRLMEAAALLQRQVPLVPWEGVQASTDPAVGPDVRHP